MGRAIRIVVEEELARMNNFKFLRAEDRIIFADLLDQCRLYALSAETLTSSVKEFPLLLSMLFVHHKRLAELEKRMKEQPK